MDSKQITLLLAAITLASVLLTQTQFNSTSSPSSNQFALWKIQHGIKYQTQAENVYREMMFLKNITKFQLHNANPSRTYDMGVNQFTAHTQSQFNEQVLGLDVPRRHMSVEVDHQLQRHISVGEVDWVSAGAVTPIKNQGSCGSCWAFSTTGALEGLNKLSGGGLKSFSEQQLVDCSSTYGNNACQGGLMDNAFKFVHDHGIVTEEEYPYAGVKQTCKISNGTYKISGFVDIKNCNDLANAVVGRPISVAVDASNWSSYKNGVFNNCKANLNHGVLLVGVNDQTWKVKNSWGANWGQNGFIRLSRGNTCGVCNAASYPIK